MFSTNGTRMTYPLDKKVILNLFSHHKKICNLEYVMHLDIKIKTIKYVAKNMRKTVQLCNWQRILRAQKDNKKERSSLAK